MLSGVAALGCGGMGGAQNDRKGDKKCRITTAKSCELEAETILRRTNAKAKAVLRAAEYPKGALLVPCIGAPLLVNYAFPALGLNDHNLMVILWVALMTSMFSEWSQGVGSMRRSSCCSKREEREEKSGQGV